jgi:hypothetical protein
VPIQERKSCRRVDRDAAVIPIPVSAVPHRIETLTESAKVLIYIRLEPSQEEGWTKGVFNEQSTERAILTKTILMVLQINDCRKSDDNSYRGAVWQTQLGFIHIDVLRHSNSRRWTGGYLQSSKAQHYADQEFRSQIHLDVP